MIHPEKFFAETQLVNLTMMATPQDVQTAVKMFCIAVLVCQAFMYRTACIACEPLLVSTIEQLASLRFNRQPSRSFTGKGPTSQQ